MSSNVFLGVIPLLERTLKEDRKAAKVRRDTYAEDSAEYAYLDKLQNAIKVLMNSAYGGFGTRRGGVFPDGFRIAAAITAAGRNWICTVKRIVESRFWLSNGILGGLDESEERPSEAQALRCIYGDTDSVFVHFPGVTVATAAEYSTGISRFFGQKVLPYPHDLEFEKIYCPFVSWKAKMYTGRKYEGKVKDGAYQVRTVRGNVPNPTNPYVSLKIPSCSHFSFFWQRFFPSLILRFGQRLVYKSSLFICYDHKGVPRDKACMLKKRPNQNNVYFHQICKMQSGWYPLHWV